MGITVTDLDIDKWFAQLHEDVDLWITDPPYPFDSRNGTGRYGGMYNRLTWKKLDDIFLKMYNKTLDGGRVYVFCNRDGLFKTGKALENVGFKPRNILVWDKQHFGGGYHWRNQVEYIIYVSKGKPKSYVKGSSNVFNYSRPKKSDAIPKIGYNPSALSAKPYKIWEDIIRNSGCDGDVCADPFSGTNPMRAALLTNATLLAKIKEAYTNTYII